jgi:PAS domain S-box-containing protein
VLKDRLRLDGDGLVEAFAEATTDVIVCVNCAGERLYVSPSCRLYGYEPEELLGGHVLDMVHPDDQARLSANTMQPILDGYVDAALDRRHRFRRKDGGWVWFEGNPVLLCDEKGRASGMINIFRDISVRRRLEAEVAGQKDRLSLLAQHAPDMLVEIDETNSIAFVSPGCRRFGYAPEDLIGRPRADLVHPDDLACVARALAAAGDGVELPATEREYRIRNKAGDWVWVEGSLALTRDDAGRIVGAVSVVRDIGERRILREQLVAARAEAEAAAAAKAAFMANITHELRTPLTSILGFGRLAAEVDGLPPAARAHIDRIAEASRALLTSVNDILDFSKLESGRLTLRPAPVSLAEYARRTLELLAPQAAAKGLDLVLEYDAPEDLTLEFDGERVRQVLLNLLGNAVKFSAAGRVALRVRHAAEGRLSAEVIDEGVGIPEADLAKLFRRFAQVDGSRALGAEGTGLGLAICKGLVELMGGEISAESTPGRGSCFGFWIPAGETAQALAAPARGPSELPIPPGVTVLIADDHPANRELVRLLLGGLGAEVCEACDGEEAVDLAARRRFDLILMDVRMPVLDGPAAVRRIRAGQGPNRATPILAFTAEASPSSLQPLGPGDLQGVLGKPIEPRELIAAVSHALHFRPEAGFDPERREATA